MKFLCKLKLHTKYMPVCTPGLLPAMFDGGLVIFVQVSCIANTHSKYIKWLLIDADTHAKNKTALRALREIIC